VAARTAPGLPLTDREAEIASLVAEGLTNRQVAKRLSLSVRTIESHLWSAYIKTGTGTGTRLTLWLIRQGGPETQKAGGLSPRPNCLAIGQWNAKASRWCLPTGRTAGFG
jgi:DNA-binding CsgD family transcriptional regulator